MPLALQPVTFLEQYTSFVHSWEDEFRDLDLGPAPALGGSQQSFCYGKTILMSIFTSFTPHSEKTWFTIYSSHGLISDSLQLP